MTFIDDYIKERSQRDHEFRDVVKLESIKLDIAVQLTHLLEKNELSKRKFTDAIEVNPKLLFK